MFPTPTAWTAPLRRMTLDALDDLNQMEARRAWSSRNAHADRAIRVGLPHAGRRARRDGYFPRAAGSAGKLRGPARREQPGQQYVSWPGGWWKRASASCSFSIGVGISTARTPGEDIRDGLTNKCKSMDRARGRLDQRPAGGGAFSTRRWWSSAASSAARRSARVAPPAASILGRDHYPDCYTMLLAGAGVKHGFSYGETDELGFSAHPRTAVHVHDLQATILHLLGFEHTRAHLSLPGPRLPPDRRARRTGERASCMS